MIAVAAIALDLILVAAVWAADTVPGGPLRRYEVRDTVEMAYFGTPGSSTPEDLDDDAVASPDGGHFIKVTHRGVLPRGMTEGTIWLFDTNSAKRSVNDAKVPVTPPVLLTRMSAAANGAYGLSVLDAGNTITEPRWCDDSRSITFLGRDGRNNRQLFRVDLDDSRVEALTPPTQDVIAYSRVGNSFAYLVGPDADLQAEQAWVSAGPGIPDITIGTGTPLMPLLYPHFGGNGYAEPVALELWQVRDGRVAPVVQSKTGTALKIVTNYWAIALSLSPDAAQVVTIAQENPSQPSGLADATASSTSLHYYSVELRTGAVDAPINVPLAPFKWGKSGRHRAAWSPDGGQIALTEVMAPPDSGTGAEPGRCTLALVNVSTRNVRCVERPESRPGLIQSVDWMPSQAQIHLRHKEYRQSDSTYATLIRHGSLWVEERGTRDRLGPALGFVIRESLNDPPVLMATDIHSGRSRPIFDPNPQLAGVALGSVSVYEWKDPHGRTNYGGLVKPPDFTPGKRYPLVIQTHGFDKNRFFTAGYSDTSNAGRALAGRDIVVLQVKEPSSTEPSWRDATELGMDVYLAAIDELAAQGVIDPKKVGITGYSYTGWLVAASITRAPARFAAAEIANSDPVTLTGYYEYVDTPLAKIDADANVGARPYGDGLKAWVDRAPSFSTDKITAPVLFQSADPWHLIGIWDMYAAMRDQGKPVELQYMRSGQHNIRKPLQVFAHQEMLVDWFDFWLNGHEDPQPAKAEQYARWRKVRETQLVSRAH